MKPKDVLRKILRLSAKSQRSILDTVSLRRIKNNIGTLSNYEKSTSRDMCLDTQEIKLALKKLKEIKNTDETNTLATTVLKTITQHQVAGPILENYIRLVSDGVNTKCNFSYGRLLSALYGFFSILDVPSKTEIQSQLQESIKDTSMLKSATDIISSKVIFSELNIKLLDAKFATPKSKIKKGEKPTKKTRTKIEAICVS